MLKVGTSTFSFVQGSNLYIIKIVNYFFYFVNENAVYLQQFLRIIRFSESIRLILATCPDFYYKTLISAAMFGTVLFFSFVIITAQSLAGFITLSLFILCAFTSFG